MLPPHVQAAKRRRCLAICLKDPGIPLEALVERLGADERSVLRWRAEVRKRATQAAEKACRRPRRL